LNFHKIAEKMFHALHQHHHGNVLWSDDYEGDADEDIAETAPFAVQALLMSAARAPVISEGSQKGHNGNQVCNPCKS
jgi:hypothetical protein